MHCTLQRKNFAVLSEEKNSFFELFNGVREPPLGVCERPLGVPVLSLGSCERPLGVPVLSLGVCERPLADSVKRNKCENMQKTVCVVFNEAITLHISYIKTSAEAYRIVQITGKIYLLDFGNMGEGNHRDVRNKK